MQRQEQQQEERKEELQPLFMTLSDITVQEEEYKNGDVLNIDKKDKEDREIKKSPMKKLRQS
jgi:hypothetical protein